MNFHVFIHLGAQHRIVGEKRPDENAMWGEALYNCLQRFFPNEGLGKWITIQEERVPDYVRLSYACFGDYSGWSSALPAEGFKRNQNENQY